MIPPEDLLIESYPKIPPGGQSVGSSYGVKVTHIPTAMIAIVQCERSQLRNRSVAIEMILGGLTSNQHRN